MSLQVNICIYLRAPLPTGECNVIMDWVRRMNFWPKYFPDQLQSIQASIHDPVHNRFLHALLSLVVASRNVGEALVSGNSFTRRRFGISGGLRKVLSV